MSPESILEEERVREELWRNRDLPSDVKKMTLEERQRFFEEQARIYEELYDPEEWKDWQESDLAAFLLDIIRYIEHRCIFVILASFGFLDSDADGGAQLLQSSSGTFVLFFQ